MVVALKCEDSPVHNWIPDQNIVVKTCREDELVLRIPVQTVDTLLMSDQSFAFGLHVIHLPQTDLAVEAGRGEQSQLWNGEQVHNLRPFLVVVHGLILFGGIVTLLHADLLDLLHIIHMDTRIHTTREKSVDSMSAPLDYTRGRKE